MTAMRLNLVFHHVRCNKYLIIIIFWAKIYFIAPSAYCLQNLEFLEGPISQSALKTAGISGALRESLSEDDTRLQENKLTCEEGPNRAITIRAKSRARCRHVNGEFGEILLRNEDCYTGSWWVAKRFGPRILHCSRVNAMRESSLGWVYL